MSIERSGVFSGKMSGVLRLFIPLLFICLSGSLMAFVDKLFFHASWDA